MVIGSRRYCGTHRRPAPPVGLLMVLFIASVEGMAWLGAIIVITMATEVIV